MSKAEELKESVQNEYDRINEDAKIARELANQIPLMEERKKEAEAKLIFVKNTPDDILEEIAPQILPYQKDDEQRFYHTPLAGLTKVSVQNLSPYSSSSGTISAFEQMAGSIREFEVQSNVWIEPIILAFDTLADEKSKKTSIPEKLDKMNEELGSMFRIAINNYDKAVNGIMNISQVAIDMRGVIQQLWGGLANLAKKQCPDSFRKIQHLQHKTDNHRILVARCFAKSKIDSIKIQQLLKRMYELTRDISRTDFGKNPLSTDLERLKEIRNRWILQIDDLVSLIGDI